MISRRKTPFLALAVAAVALTFAGANSASADHGRHGGRHHGSYSHRDNHWRSNSFHSGYSRSCTPRYVYRRGCGNERRGWGFGYTSGFSRGYRDNCRRYGW